MNSTPHDELIDAIAREMTGGEPSSDLRARVMAGLPPTRPRAWARIGAPVAAAVCLGLAWMVSGTTGTTGTTGTVPVEQLARVNNPLSASEPAGPARSAGHAARVGPDELAWRARAVAPLPAIAPMRLPPIQPAALSIAPISVDAIVTEPIVLTPIDSRAGGRE